MSVLDMVKSKVKELTDPEGPASEMMQTAKTSLAHGLDGASKFVDEKTGGKYSSTIHNGVGKAKEFLGEQSKDGTGASATGDGTTGGSTGRSYEPSQAEELPPQQQ